MLRVKGHGNRHRRELFLASSTSSTQADRLWIASRDWVRTIARKTADNMHGGTWRPHPNRERNELVVRMRWRRHSLAHCRHRERVTRARKPLRWWWGRHVDTPRAWASRELPVCVRTVHAVRRSAVRPAKTTRNAVFAWTSNYLPKKINLQKKLKYNIAKQLRKSKNH